MAILASSVAVAEQLPGFELSDVDGDGDMDVVVAMFRRDPDSRMWIDQEIAWFENRGAEGFAEKQVISDDVDFPQDVAVADMDGDGDQDVIAAEYVNGIAWYENLTGNGDFGDKHVIAKSRTVEVVYNIEVADLDDDGDYDVLSAGSDVGPGDLSWFENVDAGRMFVQHRLGHALAVDVGDLDGDGDLDVLAFRGWLENRMVVDPRPPLAGDANLDGKVEFADFLLLSTNFGKQADAVWSEGDFKGDEIVSFEDFLILATKCGRRYE